MNFQGLNFHLSLIVLMSLVGCASASHVPAVAASSTEVTSALAEAPSAAPQAPIEITQKLPKKQAVDNGVLICKASRNRFHYDWSAGSLASGQGLIDQNNIRYEFRSAGKPAGERGENLKIGECGWAGQALAEKAGKGRRSQVVFSSLSDEATQTFYKMKTGKVFKFPVRQTKNGLVAAPGGVSVVR